MKICGNGTTTDREQKDGKREESGRQRKQKRIPSKTQQKRNNKQSDRKEWRRSCLTQGNARKRENIEEKTKRREDKDGKHRKSQSLGHKIIFTYQTPYVTCNSPHAELSRDQDVRPREWHIPSPLCNSGKNITETGFKPTPQHSRHSENATRWNTDEGGSVLIRGKRFSFSPKSSYRLRMQQSFLYDAL